MAENTKGSNQNQGPRNAQPDLNKQQKQGADKIGGQADTVGNRDAGDASKSKMSPGVDPQDRKRQGAPTNQGNLGGQAQGVSSPNKMSPDKDRVEADVDVDDDERPGAAPNLDRERQK